MRRDLLLILIAGLLGVILGGRLGVGWPPGTEGSATPSAPALPRLAELEELADLITLRVPLIDVVETRLDGYAGAARCLLIVRGEADVGVDLKRVEIVEVDTPNRTLTLDVPPATVRSVRIDHQRSRVVALERSGLWQFVGDDTSLANLTDQAYAIAEQRLREAAGAPEHAARAREALVGWLSMLMWEKGWKMGGRWNARCPSLYAKDAPHEICP